MEDVNFGERDLGRLTVILSTPGQSTDYVLSELVKPQPNASVLAWLRERDDLDLFVSAMTVAELKRGVARMTVSRRRTELSAWLEKLQKSFDQRVLAFTAATADYWAELCARAESVGKPMAAFDTIIAACAPEHVLAVVTRNVSDFAPAPVMVIDPCAS